MVLNHPYNNAYKTILFLWITSSRSWITWAQDRNLDRFNYDQTRTTDTYQDFGPEDWGDLLCPDLETCVCFCIIITKKKTIRCTMMIYIFCQIYTI